MATRQIRERTQHKLDVWQVMDTRLTRLLFFQVPPVLLSPLDSSTSLLILSALRVRKNNRQISDAVLLSASLQQTTQREVDEVGVDGRVPTVVFVCWKDLNDDFLQAIETEFLILAELLECECRRCSPGTGVAVDRLEGIQFRLCEGLRARG